MTYSASCSRSSDVIVRPLITEHWITSEPPMEILVEAHTVRVRDWTDLRRIDVRTTVNESDTCERLRQRGIGYVDGNSAYINAFWLQSASDSPVWHDAVRELLSFAECHGWFDGVYLRLNFAYVRGARPRIASRALT
ncbi:hypothetical protein [Nocardia cyriacigeorgica]|uniref:hypothetical protein n=1 Tax=Nocardia cyriacigeorgica TaxID=135487 RepID=UPI0024540EDA|nr:hypothetical protein [Nocardia cyriacigeorgica]